MALSLAFIPMAVGQIQTRSPEAGFPRAWEAGMAVNRYTTVNLFNGNAITVIPIMACDPVGPALHFELYHNLAGSDDASGPDAYWGFDLGGGWRVAFGSRLVEDGETGDVLLIEDDGNEWVYEALGGGEYGAPYGKFDVLVQNQDDSWTLTRLSQWKRDFDDEGRLVSETDSAGNVLTVNYANDRFDYIASAAAARPAMRARTRFSTMKSG